MIGSPIECIQHLTRCDPEREYEVREHRQRRSLTQNAYYWAMLNKLAAKLGYSDSEVHKDMLRDYGVCEVFYISKAVPLDDYFKYYDVQQVIGDSLMVKVYKGSSHMDSSEFTRLINGMREECELQGIDVMTPEEMARLAFVEPEGSGR